MSEVLPVGVAFFPHRMKSETTQFRMGFER